MRTCLVLVSVLCTSVQVAFAATDSITALEKASERPAEGVMDNSFLVEEAYNQEPGVVQHILNVAYSSSRRAGPDERALSFLFTQEWPVFTQTHQFAYSIPYSFLDADGREESGFEDITLNYRYQAWLETPTRPAFTPSLSVILPTGEAAKGLGDDTVGSQLNLTMSKVVSDRWTVHGNAGASLFPDVSGHDLVSYNLGASAIYAVSTNFNFMLEAVVDFEEEVDDFGRTDRAAAVVLSPGFRYAINHPGDAQTVIGLAVPIGLTDAAPDFGVFLYASFEHFFHRSKSIASGK